MIDEIIEKALDPNAVRKIAEKTGAFEVIDVTSQVASSKNPHRCVIDKKRMYVTLILIELVKDKETIVGYTLKEGEALIETSPPPSGYPQSFQWNGSGWDDLRTPEEIEAEKLPAPPEPSEIERRLADAEDALMELAELTVETQSALFEVAGGL